ncbi:hypothetical protein AAY473_040046 [Plecturocebus cupreus]
MTTWEELSHSMFYLCHYLNVVTRQQWRVQTCGEDPEASWEIYNYAHLILHIHSLPRKAGQGLDSVSVQAIFLPQTCECLALLKHMPPQQADFCIFSEPRFVMLAAGLVLNSWPP